MSVTGFEGDVDEAWYEGVYKNKFIKDFDKFSYRLVECFGDLYYQKISKEKAFKQGYHFEKDPAKTLKSQHEIDCFIQDNMN